MTSSTRAPAARQVGGQARRQAGPRRDPTRRGDRPLWLLIPVSALLLVIVVLPLVFAIWLALTNLDQYTLRSWTTAPFIGLANATEALTDSPLLAALGRSVAFALLTTLISLPIGVLAAFAVNDRFRGRAAIRSLFLLPYVLPSFVVGTIWRTFLEPTGVVNQALSHLGIDGGNWLIGSRSFLTIVAVDIWASWPFIYLLTLAGLQSIEREVHEAAAVDGAGYRSKIVSVVLPSLRAPLALAVIISTLNHLNNFSLPFLLLGSPAPDASNLLPVAIYTESFTNFRFSLAAVMAIISMILIMIPLLVYLRVLRLDTGTDRNARTEVEAA